MIAASLLVLLVLALLLLRQNMLVILGAAAAYAYVAFGGGQAWFIVLDAWEAINREVLLSIPLFILAGNIMSRGEMARRLIDVMRAATVRVPGGLALAAILSGAAFASISGSGTVTLLAVGSIVYPALLAAGYPKPFALGALCASGTLGIVIPPSIPLILYGVMTQTSITELFVAGIGPGLLLTLLFAAYAMLTCRSRAREPWSGAALIRSARAGIWAMLMPVVVLGGIYSGYFTATESAAVAVVYALLVETCVYRELRMAALRLVMIDTARMLGALFPVLMLAVSLNVFLTYEQVPELLVAGISDRISSTTGFLLLTNLLLLAVGCVVDIGSAVLLLAPLLEPLAAARGVDPVHFGILMLVNLEIGYLTPPMGLNLIVAMLAFREDFATVCRAVVPFILLMLLALLAVSFWPPLSLFLLD